jgi:RimJ/RimL family protein N-acetyltransferase
MERAPPEILTTNRLVLRPLRAGDAGSIHEAFGDPTVVHYWPRPAHTELAQTQAMIERMMANAAMDIWALTTAAGPLADRAMGWIMLKDVRDGVSEVGYVLARAHWGNGYAGEALAAIVAHGFGRGLHRIEADTDPENERSIALLERNGFVREGVLRAAWKTHIGLRDTLMLAIVRTDAS